MSTARDRSADHVLDELLVLRAQAGDRRAIERLVERWQPRLAGYARRLTGSAEAARDVVQDAWLGIVRGLGRLEDPRRFGGFALRIVARRAVDASRRAGSAALLHDPPAEGVVEPAPAVARVRAAIATLPPDRRVLLALRYRFDADERTMARLLGIPVGTVKSRLHHAREQLRLVLERKSDEQPR